MIGILNDDYEGGELTFFEDHKIETRTGDIIIFPSCFLYPHAIQEVVKGTRYSFVSWAW
jgi:predicted 2-oxoglutarate/Fe(II)-dependent dioxygenase YbiX